MNWTVLSPCGTSLLTNGIDDNLRKLLNNRSNEKDKESVEPADLLLIETRIKEVTDSLNGISKDKIAKMSAELNTIIKLYSERERAWGNKQDFHWLVCTDTWLGEVTANLVKTWLENEGFVVQVHRQRDLRTQTIDEFQLALSDLTKWCYESLPEPQNQNARVIFNLTGGFKSVNGFLQTIGMFRADETVYILEGEKRLLSIPRLPIGLTSKELVRQNMRGFRRLSLELPIDDTMTIPETLVLRMDGEAVLSAWGEIQWNECKSDLYSEGVFPPPDGVIEFSPRVEKKLRFISTQIS